MFQLKPLMNLLCVIAITEFNITSKQLINNKYKSLYVLLALRGDRLAAYGALVLHLRQCQMLVYALPHSTH